MPLRGLSQNVNVAVCNMLFAGSEVWTVVEIYGQCLYC